ncbi:MAG: Ig-like domain-containing protein [Bacilli bacterium]|nr:Ig-like domain-containing protein [Bacilli bacterium]
MNKNGKIILTTLSLLLGSAAMVGCGPKEEEPVVVEFSNITLSDSTVEVNFGGEKQLSATVTANVETYSEVVAWTSSNPAVATVSSTGKVTAVAAGTTVITAKIGDVTAICNVTVLEKVPVYTFVGLTPKESFTISKTNKGTQTNKEEEFVEKGKTHVVGTENAISVLPDLKLMDVETFTDYSNGTGSIAKWDKDFIYTVKKVEGTTKVDPAQGDFEVTDNRAGKVKFNESAIGNTYEIKVTAGGLTPAQADRANASVTYEVSVVKGYNVYTAKELSYADQRASGEESRESHGGDINFLANWAEFKTANGLDPDYHPECLVFQDNINITVNDIPSGFFYSAEDLKNSNDDKSIGSLKDSVDIYKYLGKTAATPEGSIENTLKVYGNYFTMDCSSIPLIKRDSGSKTEVGRVISHGALFRIGNGSMDLQDLKIKGNGKRAINEEDRVYGGGLIIFKESTKTKLVSTTNLISRQCFITYFGELPNEENPYIPEFEIRKCKSFDNYNSFIYNWGGVCKAYDSIFGMCGGPVIIADHADFSGDPETNNADQLTYQIHGKAPESVFYDCTFDNYVAGTEAWFAQMGATGLVPQIKSMGDLMAPYGMTYVTNKNKVASLSSAQDTVTMFNLIALNKVNGPSLSDVQKPACGEVKIVETGKSESVYNYARPNVARVDGAKEIMTELMRVKNLAPADQAAAVPGLVALATKYNVSFSPDYSDLTANLQAYCETVGKEEFTKIGVIRANGGQIPVFQAGNAFTAFDGQPSHGLQDISNVPTWTTGSPNFSTITPSHDFVTSKPTTVALYYSGMLMVFGVSYFQK